MIKHKELQKHCKKMFLDFDIIEESVLSLDGEKYLIIDDEQMLFDEDFNFIPLSDSVYEFCGRWYLQKEGEPVSMQELKYIGEPKLRTESAHFIGVHSGNELLNGVGLYDEWIKKAKFLGIKSLGICEKDSVRGSMEFQKKCLKNGLKPIIGISLTIKDSNGTYVIKAYCKDFQGWQNVLKFTYKLNVEGQTSIDEDFLVQNKEGLHIVIDTKFSDFKDYSKITKYYQLDTVVFEEEGKDISFTNTLEKFLKSGMGPVLLCDAYYLEQSEWEVREKLWGIAKAFDYKTKNQHFKNNDEIAIELLQMFEKGDNTWVKVFKEAQLNLNTICEECNFEYDTTSRHLPKYTMTEEESKVYSSNEQLFMSLVKKGFKERNIPKEDSKKYVDRLKKEIDVLKKGDVVDYFLITRDILDFAKREEILLGIGRGSAGGCLVSYLLGIIQIDPLEFDLIFERFLNFGRMGSLEECKAYLIETNDGNIRLNEKSVLKVLRNGLEKNIFVEDLIMGDDIIKY